MTRIDDLRALLALATARPWAHDEEGRWGTIINGDDDVLMIDECEAADAALLVAAVNALPDLLDIADAAEALLAAGPLDGGGFTALEQALARLEGR